MKRKELLTLRKRLAWILACVAVVAQPPLSAQEESAIVNKPVTDKWAVVVGVSKFANPALNLRYPAKDAQDFYNYLITRGNFKPDHVKLLLNEKATRERILDVLGDSWLPRVALPDDLVVIFISSHGSASDSDICGVNYVVAHDTNPDKLFTTGIAMKSLAGTIKDRVHAERVLVVLDTCHAGGASESKGLTRAANADALALAQGTGQMVVCSSDKNQVSWEGKSIPNSVFTRSLIDAFQEKGASVPISQVFNTVKERVQEQVVRERGVLQTPIVETSKWSGKELVLGCEPIRPRPGLPELPEETQKPQPAVVASATLPAPRNQPVAAPTKSFASDRPDNQPQSSAQTRPVTTSASTSVSGGGDSPRRVAKSSAIDFLRYHFRIVGEKLYLDAWDDLGRNYRAKFKNDPRAYQASVSRHRWLDYNASDSDFSILPGPGQTIKVRVRMNRLTGFSGYWVYTISTFGGLYAIEDVTVG